jgi:hypothetical protein
MNPNATEFQKRREIEQILAPLADAEERLRPVLMRMVDRARTDYERLDIQELLIVREKLQVARRRIAEFHPNGRKDSNHDTREIQ